MDIKDKDLLNELIIESQEHIANIEPDLLILERDKDAVSDELINKIFRAVHSVKGGFGFYYGAEIDLFRRKFRITRDVRG